ncbi:hypothetical protein TNCV_330431 [Trichonephila clavipes]|nr:hypothetical protein TNCV_330431 [Trichonephila clavipes]
MVLKANDRRTSCPCHEEFRGPRSDYVRQVSHGPALRAFLLSLVCQSLKAWDLLRHLMGALLARDAWETEGPLKPASISPLGL